MVNYMDWGGISHRHGFLILKHPLFFSFSFFVVVVF